MDAELFCGPHAWGGVGGWENGLVCWGCGGGFAGAEGGGEGMTSFFSVGWDWRLIVVVMVVVEVEVGSTGASSIVDAYLSYLGVRDWFSLTWASVASTRANSSYGFSRYLPRTPRLLFEAKSAMGRVRTRAGKSYSTSPSSTIRSVQRLTLSCDSSRGGFRPSSRYLHNAKPMASATVTCGFSPESLS